MRSSPYELDPDPEQWTWVGPTGSGLETLREYESWAATTLAEAGVPVEPKAAERELWARGEDLRKPLGTRHYLGGGIAVYTATIAEKRARQEAQDAKAILQHAADCLEEIAATRAAADAGDMDAVVLHSLRTARAAMFGAWYKRMKRATDLGVRVEWGGRKGAGKQGRGPFANTDAQKPGPDDYRAAADPLLLQGVTKREAARLLAPQFGVGVEAVRKALKGYSPVRVGTPS